MERADGSGHTTMELPARHEKMREAAVSLRTDTTEATEKKGGGERPGEAGGPVVHTSTSSEAKSGCQKYCKQRCL